MAADTVDEVIESVLASDTGFAGQGKSVTANLPLRGKAGFDTLPDAATNFSEVTPVMAKHLGSRHGGEARALFQLIQKDPLLGEPLVAGLPYLRAEAVYAVHHEMANTVDDVLSRRTRARIYGRDDSLRATAEVGSLMAAAGGWSDELREECELQFIHSVESERDAAGLPHTALADLF
jgi:glycerol-3-phosphate dehydrogenase